MRMIAFLMEEVLNFLNFWKEEEKNIKKNIEGSKIQNWNLKRCTFG